MKKRTVLLLAGALTMGSFAFADIQAPLGSHWNWSRKLSRSIANLAYGYTEYPVTWQKVERTDGMNAAAASFVVDGTKRTLVRLGYGFYELFTFPIPTNKGTFKPHYYSNERFDPWHGYEEFPPQMGFTSQARYGREQSW